MNTNHVHKCHFIVRPQTNKKGSESAPVRVESWLMKNGVKISKQVCSHYLQLAL